MARCFILLLVLLLRDETFASVTNSRGRQSRHTIYQHQQSALNTPHNSNGHLNHNYFLQRGTGTGNAALPARTAAPAQLPADRARADARNSAQSSFQSRAVEYSTSNSGSGLGGNFGTSVTSSSNVNTAGNGGSFSNQQSSSSRSNSNFGNYQVTLQGTLLNDNNNNNGGHGNRAVYDSPRPTVFLPQPQPQPHSGTSLFPYNFVPRPSEEAAGGAAVDAEWPFSDVIRETMREFSDRALLEEAASDTTGQTHCLDVPRCSYVPFRKECQGHELIRTEDGTCNNQQHPLMGSAFQPYKRYLKAKYDDGVASPRNSSVMVGKQGRPLPLPSPRLISRTVHLVTDDASQEFSGLLMQFGQFVDHDITGSSSITGKSGAIICCGEKKQEHEACLPIAIPPGDTFFTDSTCINFVRSLAVKDELNRTLVPREQRNEVTAFLDASVVYGSTGDQQNNLRRFQHGLLKCSEGEMLPLEVGGCAAADGLCLTAGDTRVNEIPGLGALHTVFHRQHNRLARALLGLLPEAIQARIHPLALDEAVFQTARRILYAQLQHVIYNQWLPLVLGPFTVSHYGLSGEDQERFSYDNTRDPQIANVFAAAAFRFGHSLVPSSVRWGDEHIPLHRVFSNPKWVRKDVDKVLQGLLHVPAQNRDQFFVTGLRNRLFEPAPKRGLDLIAMNIQRGRDHGLPPYNLWRETCGLPKVHGFNDSALGSAGPALREVYLSVDDIDLFTGAISEPSLPGAVVGPTLACLIGKQFADLRNGDRFFYQTPGPEGFTQGQLRVIEATTMAELLCANSNNLASVQRNPFIKRSTDKNPPIPCTQLKQMPSLQAWGQELQDLIYYLSN